MLRRWSFGLLLSLLVHAGVVAVGLALGGRGLGGPVDIELKDVRTVELKDFPLGGPERGAQAKPRGRAHPRNRAPEVAAATGTLAARPGDEERKRGSSPAADEAGPAPTSDLAAYGPVGSRLTVLMRLDRLRGTDYQSAVDDLLLRLPDRRELLQGTGLDLFADFDALLVATPNPLDPSVTFLAVRHHLKDGAMRAALTRAARGTERTLVWQKEEGRLVGERLSRRDGTTAATRHSDDRMIVVADPGLALVTPPAYRKLLLAPAPSPVGGAPDGGMDGRDPDAGAAARASEQAAQAGGWATLLGRIDAEEGLMPPSGVVMLKVVDLFTSAGALPRLFGLEMPPIVSGTVGIDDFPFLDIVAEFKEEGPALHWEAEWPALQRRLRTHPYAIVSGFSALVSRATLAREGTVVRLHVMVTHDEAVRLLSLALQILGSRGI